MTKQSTLYSPKHVAAMLGLRINTGQNPHHQDEELLPLDDSFFRALSRRKSNLTLRWGRNNKVTWER
jgi:hypothetical protein